MPRRMPGTSACGVVVGAHGVVDEGAPDGAVAGGRPDQALVGAPLGPGQDGGPARGGAAPDRRTAVPTAASAVGRAGVDQVDPQAGGRGAAAGVDPHLDAVGVRDDQGVGARPLVRRLGGAGVGGVLGRLLRQGDQSLQPPPARVRTQAANEPAGTLPSQVTPTTEKPDVASGPLETAGRRPAGAGCRRPGARRGWPRAGRAPAAPRATAIGAAVRLRVCTEVRTGWGAAAAGRRGAGRRRCPAPSA